MKFSANYFHDIFENVQKVNGVKNEKINKELSNGPVEYEDAIAAVGFGRFNIMLMVLTVSSCFACIFNTTTNSFVSPSAECDLQLSLVDKGVLNVITHGGMIASAFLVGYLADTLGRKKILVFGFLMDGLINMISSTSHNFWMLVILKFFAGFIIGGPSTVLMTCLAEFHSSTVRPKMIMFCGVCFSIASLTIPLVALSILSNPWDFVITSDYVFHAWQRFIAVCSLPSILAGLFSILIPESPRFLASRGRSDEALAVLRRIYEINTGLPQDSFPVKELKSICRTSSENTTDTDEHKTEDKECAAEEETKDIKVKENALTALKGGFKQLRPLFFMPHLSNVVLVLGIQFGALLGCNTMRLWLPQLFKTMSEHTDTDSSLCNMISLKNTSSVIEAMLPESGVCELTPIKSEMYLNSAIVAGVHVGLSFIASILIGFVGNRMLLRICLLCAGLCTLGMYWCGGANEARFVAAIAVSFSAISGNAVLSVVVDLFPTALRSMAVSMTMMVGRIGSIIGSVTFPVLLASGCLTPFLTIGAILGCGALLALFIPVPKKIVTQS